MAHYEVWNERVSIGDKDGEPATADRPRYWTVSSPITKRVYNHALHKFFDWLGAESRGGLSGLK